MKRRILLLLVMALIAGGGTVWFAKNWLNAQRAAFEASRQTEIVVAAPQNQQPVLVVAQDLPAGRILQEDDLVWRNWPEESVGEEFIVFDSEAEADKDIAKQALNGSVLRHAMPGGTPLQQNRVVSPGERGFLAAVLSPGNRAVSVPVDATSGIAGFVFPGDRVDLILTFKVDKGERFERQASQTVLTDIRVLAIDQATANEEGEARVAKTATLEVTAKEGEKVALALRSGRLTLALRSLATEKDGDAETGIADIGRIAPTAVPWTLEKDLSSLMGNRRAAPVAASGGKPRPTVTVLRGGQKSGAQ